MTSHSRFSRVVAVNPLPVFGIALLRRTPLGGFAETRAVMAVNPIQIVPLRSDANAPVIAPKLTYRGGPLISAVQVFTCFWGDPWRQGPQAAIALEVNQFFDFVVGSALIDQLSEYSVPGRPIDHGAFVGTRTVAGSLPSTSVTDADIQRLIQQEISSDPGFPQPTANSLYYVFLPAGISVNLGGSASCVGFCGYHSDIAGRVYYAVMPYPDCSGCLGGVSDIDALTSTSSHELCEAITDPIPGQGWYDDANGEIGDICAWQTKRLGAYSVQLEWSNRAGRCL
jgi:hypothetical protein